MIEQPLTSTGSTWTTVKMALLTPSRHGTPARFLAILSGRRRSAAAELGWIVVARGLVLEDRRKAWVNTLAGTNDDMSRFRVMHRGGIGGSTEGYQKA